jgi:two-component system OmpR family response regulator
MRLLVVEDEEHLAVGLKYNFQAEGFEVDTVGDGPAALKMMRDHPEAYDLVILDVMLPGMSGYDVCTEIRQFDVDVPILMLTARTLSEDRTRAFECGTDQYLAKPFDLRELLARVRNLTERRGRRSRPRPAEDHFEFSDARIDFRRLEALVGGKRKSLTPMEFRLLELFVRNEGVVLSRAAILDKVWGISPPPATRTVDNFVMRLRKHFEKDPAQPRYFTSVRGAGYRFVAGGEDSSSAATPDD